MNDPGSACHSGLSCRTHSEGESHLWREERAIPHLVLGWVYRPPPPAQVRMAPLLRNGRTRCRSLSDARTLVGAILLYEARSFHAAPGVVL